MSNRIKIVLLIAFIGLVALATSAQAQSTSMQLGRTGQLIEPTAKTPSPKTLQLDSDRPLGARACRASSQGLAFTA
jgi:hypothetical protein